MGAVRAVEVDESRVAKVGDEDEEADACFIIRKNTD